MATRKQQSTQTGSSKTSSGYRPTRSEVKEITDHNERRRLLYATDPAYRARVLKRSRAHYNKGQFTSKLEDGVLRSGVKREVEIEGRPDLIVLECYTVRETGEALGRVRLTIKAWMDSGILPPPIIKEAHTGYVQYCRQELDVVAEAIARHETHSQYISSANHELIDTIWFCVEEVRKELIGGESCDDN